MANEQQLGEFINNLLDDLQSGAITAEEALVASSQYEYIRTLLSQHAQDLTNATTEGDESLKNTLVSIFSQTKSRLSELPAFASQNPDIVRDEKQTRDAAALEHFAFETIRKETKTKSASRKQSRREFIHTLVSQYSARTNSPISESKMDSIVESSLSSALKEQSSQGAQHKFVKEISQGLGIIDPAFEKILESTIAKDATNTVIGSWKETNIEREALTTLFTHPEITRPDVVADVFLHANENALLVDVSARAVKLAQTAEAVASLGTKPLTTKGPFFSNSNTRGAIKGVQQAADGILSLVGEPLREIILKEKINGTLRSVLRGANQLTDRLGEKFIHSSVFSFVTQNVLRGANEKPTMSQSTAIFGDVFSSIFRGPLQHATTQGTKDNVYDYLELARASSNAPKGFSFLNSTIMPWHIESLRANYTQSMTRGATQKHWLPSIGLYKLGSLGGNALANIFDRFVGFAFAGPSIARQLHASRRAAAVPIPLSEDLPMLLSLFVILIIILLFVFPTFLNVPHLSTMQKMSALLASLSKSDSILNESCPDCDWPVKCGCIYGAPFTGTHSGSHLNAVDFVFGKCSPSEHVPIFSVEDGVVTTASKQYADNEFQNSGKSSYGNYVEIKGKHDVLYGHFSTILVNEGDRVTKGQQIGTSDNNGYSEGEHLHFQLNNNSDMPLDKQNDVFPEPATINKCISE